MTSISPADLDKQAVTKAYARWAPFYDFVFGAVFERGREAAIAAAERVGGRILDVGIGTGIALPLYSKGCQLCGSIFPNRCCARRGSGSPNSAEQCRRSLGDGRREHVVSRCVVRRGDRAPRRHYGAEPRSGAGRVRARAQAGRRDHPDEPGRRRGRTAALDRALVRAGGAQARLALGIPVRALRALDATDPRHAAGRNRPVPPFGHFSVIRFVKDAAEATAH